MAKGPGTFLPSLLKAQVEPNGSTSGFFMFQILVGPVKVVFIEQSKCYPEWESVL